MTFGGAGIMFAAPNCDVGWTGVAQLSIFEDKAGVHTWSYDNAFFTKKLSQVPQVSNLYIVAII